MKVFLKSARQLLIQYLVKKALTENLTANQIKALQSVINRLEIRDAGGYEKFRQVLEAES